MPELGWLTYEPSLFTGVGFHCESVPPESFAEYVIDNGKAVLKVLDWVSRLPFPL